MDTSTRRSAGEFTANLILDYIRENPGTTAKKCSAKLCMDDRTVYRHLNERLADKVQREGRQLYAK